MSQTFYKIYKNPERVAEQFAQHLAEWVAEGEGEPFHIALSGGSTPRILFDLLAKDYAHKLPWEILHFWWGDERCVPPDDPESNFGMTRRHLLEHIDIPKENIHRVRGESDPKLEAIRYEKEIRQWVPSIGTWPKFDLMMLGLGSDGHTASIFPHQIGLLEDPNICVVATHPESGQQRISLSGNAINHARKIAFLATGSSKTEKYTEIVNRTGNYEQYPAAYITPSEGELFWFIDEAAAGK